LNKPEGLGLAKKRGGLILPYKFERKYNNKILQIIFSFAKTWYTYHIQID
jgi:hypothetical protein